jgi:hypothetical protein
MLLLRLEKEAGHLVESHLRDPALRALPAFARADEPGANQLLQVMGHRRLPDTEPPPQLTDAETGALPRVATAPLAATGQPEEDRQPMWMGQRLEGDGNFSWTHISIIIDISYDVKAWLSHGRTRQSLPERA